MPTLAISRRRHSVFRLSVCAWSYTKSLWTPYLTNRLSGFHTIYNWASGRKDERIWLWGRKATARPNTPGAHDTDILKAVQVQLQTSGSQATFPADAYRSTVGRRRPSSFAKFLNARYKYCICSGLPTMLFLFSARKIAYNTGAYVVCAKRRRNRTTS